MEILKHSITYDMHLSVQCMARKGIGPLEFRIPIHLFTGYLVAQGLSDDYYKEFEQLDPALKNPDTNRVAHFLDWMFRGRLFNYKYILNERPTSKVKAV